MNNLPKELLESLEDAFGKVPYEHLENEVRSLKTLEKLRQSFLARGNAKPAAYGSVHLDDDGILAISVVDGDPRLKREIAEAIGGERYYTVDVAYPWSYLEATSDVVSEYMAQRPESPMMDNLVGVGADERSNKVVVEMLDVSEAAVLAFKRNVIDSPAFVFKKVEGRPEPYVTMDVGSGVNIGSIACRVASYIGQASGFIASGHCYTYVGQIATVGSTNVGTTVSRSCGGNVDAAYLSFISGNSMTNTIAGTSSTLSTTGYGAVSGMYVYARGDATKALTTGYVSNISKTITFTDNITRTDQIEVTAISIPFTQGGDSGCILCSVSGLLTMGINVGGSTSTKYFTKYYNASDLFCVSRY